MQLHACTLYCTKKGEAIWCASLFVYWKSLFPLVYPPPPAKGSFIRRGGHGQSPPQATANIDITRLLLRSDDGVADKEVDEDGADVWFEFSVQHPGAYLVAAHEQEFIHLAVVGAGDDIRGQFKIVHVQDLGMVQVVARIGVGEGDGAYAADVLGNEVFRERCLFGRLGEDAVEW